VLSVNFVQSKKLFNTCFLIAPWLDLCGRLFVLHLGLPNGWMWGIFLVLGLEVFRTIKGTLY
jgi:hypothetical protein